MKLTFGSELSCVAAGNITLETNCRLEPLFLSPWQCPAYAKALPHGHSSGYHLDPAA